MTYSQTGKRTLFVVFLAIILILTAAVLTIETADAAEGTPISSEADFKKISKNLDGDYYLTADIKLSSNTVIKGTFTGTLDGKGYSINMYSPTKLSTDETYTFGRFMSAEGATFKNIKLKGATIKVSGSWGDPVIGGLVGYAKDCTFQKISITGTTKFTLNGGLDFGGIVGKAADCLFKSCTTSSKSQLIAETTADRYVCIGRFAGQSDGCTFEKCTTAGTVSIKSGGQVRHQGFVEIGNGTDVYKNCTNKANITVSSNGYLPRVSGIGQIGTYENCKNTGDIVCSFKNADGGGLAAGIMCAYEVTDKLGVVYNSSNSGDITVTYTGRMKDDRNGTNDAATGGIATFGSAYNCKNSGKIKVYMKTSSMEYTQCAPQIGGIVGNSFGMGYWEYVEGSNIIEGCKNTGSISFTDSNKTSPYVYIGGVTGYGGLVSKSSNTASVTVTKEEQFSAGGIAGHAYGVENSYNTGKITGKGTGYAGGVAGEYAYMELYPGNFRWNYNTGTVEVVAHKWVGTVLGYGYGDGVYENYTTKGKPYSYWCGELPGETVDAITFENCPGLSPDVWKMNKDNTRLIFK